MEDTEPLELSGNDSSSVAAEAKIELPDRDLQELFYANGDKLLHDIERETGLFVAGRDAHLTLRGSSEAIEHGKRVIGNIINLFLNKKKVQEKDLSLIIRK